MKKVLVIVGPTGVGKSELSLELAEKYHGEIISGDSVQVYKELNIGSAKVSESARQKIPHHLVDEYDLDEAFDVRLFQQEARRLIDEISDRGNLPIIVGGTGLYINAVLKNYIFQEEPDNTQLIQKLESLSNEVLHQKLLECDPVSAHKLHPNNRQRIIRAIVIAKTTDKTKSEIEKKQRDQLLYDANIVSLTMPRDQLYERINERVLKMMEAGLLEEVESIVDEYDDAFSLRGMSGIGYKEWKPYFEEKVSKDRVVKEIQKRSRNFAKRQYTWFNNQMDVDWYDITTPDYKVAINDSIKEWLHD